MFDTKKLFNEIKSNPLVQKVQTSFEDNPASTLVGVAAVIGSVAKLISAVGGARGSFAYAQGEKRRAKAAKRK
jgi:hypothetical protein